jgi:hypothetical protein
LAGAAPGDAAPQRLPTAGSQPQAPQWTERTGRHRLTHAARGATALERRREQTLAEWYGPALAPAEIAAHRAGPRPLADLLDEALRGIRSGDASVLERVCSLWPALAGDDVARRALPVALREHVLTVEVANATWRYVLEREHQVRLRCRLREATAGAVAEIRFVPPGRALGPGAQ